MLREAGFSPGEGCKCADGFTALMYQREDRYLATVDVKEQEVRETHQPNASERNFPGRMDGGMGPHPGYCGFEAGDEVLGR